MNTKPLSYLALIIVAVLTMSCSQEVSVAAPPEPPMMSSDSDVVPPPEDWPPLSGPVFDDFVDFATSTKYWDYEYGQPGLVNKELQTYGDSRDNVRLDGKGNLIIEAHKTADGYTSGRLITRGKVDMLYGRVEARIKFPSGQGIWPAFWLLGSSIDAVGWPYCGEIDIMELVNVGTTYHASIHGPPPNTDYADSDAVSTTGEIADLSTEFHVYWSERQTDLIKIGVDDRTLATFTPESLPTYAAWVFNQPMYAVLNVAVGGEWPGNPDESTRFPATMVVDWFRYTP